MSRLDDTLRSLGLPAALRSALDDFIRLFHKWNERINLSAARSETDIAEHVVDCLQLVPHLRDAVSGWPLQPAPVLDVGAGGGLPSVVVAVCLPGVAVTALEPIHKKHAFLRTTARELSLANLSPVAVRLEAHARRDYAATMSRATLDLRDWLSLGAHHIASGGTVFGFEAVPRADLPPGTIRHPYTHQNHTRAIVALRT